jgi:[acyl-carrier-protein] S-malonyltransferase
VTAASATQTVARASAVTAWLFPGQGAEAAGALRVRPGPTADLVTRAGHALGVDLARIIATGEPRLGRTEIAQPALIAVCLGIAEELEGRGESPEVVAGHSLGELAAAATAGCLSAADAVDLAVERGLAMAEAARAHPGAMAAVRADDAAALEPLLAIGRARGRITVAAHNAPTQWVLSGDRAAIAAVGAATPATVLPTEGAWHSDAMAAAAERWLRALRGVRFQPPSRPLILNRTGRALGPGDDLAALLAGQLTRPIAWTATLRTAAERGATRFVAIGPGKALRGLCRETLGASCNVVVASGNVDGGR